MKKSEKRKLRHGAKDIAHTIVKAGISAIPGIGGPAAELFSEIIVPPLCKRRDKWIEEIAEGLTKLEEKFEGFKIDNLYKNEMFITTVMHASQVAMRNHQEEKLEALRNAVLNSALPNPPENDLQQIFLNLIDILSTWHIIILRYFQNPIEWEVREKHPRPYPNLYDFIKDPIFGDIIANDISEEFYQKLINDLCLYGMLKKVDKPISYMGGYLYKLTVLGELFLKFITSPLSE